jgi:NitT/TauT family transport system substrate-binding protein
MLCLPTNLAANLAAKQNDFITVLSINCLGSLYVVTDGTVTVNSINDLAGKTVYYGEPTSTTPAILNFLLEQNGIKDQVTLEALATNELVGEKIIKGEVSIAVLPEPKATATLAQAAKNENNTKNYSISLNISEEWDKVSDSPLTMGCIIVSNKFLKEHKSAVDAFLKEYKASIEYIGNKSNLDSAAKMIADAKILPSEPIAKKALNNLYGSIVYIDGKDMKNSLKQFYAAINLQANPGDNFYYEK